jgi:hypothetical protein
MFFFGVKQNSSFVILVEVRGKILWLSAVVMLVSRNPPLLCLLLLLTFAPSCLSNPGEGAEEEFRNVSNKSEITFKSRASQVQLLHGHHHGNPFVLTAINRMLWFVSRSCHDSNVRPPSPHHAGNSKLQIARLRLSPRSAIAELELDLER